MTNEAFFLQLISQIMHAYGATVHFEHVPEMGLDFWARLPDEPFEDPACDALARIAAALRGNTSDFACIDEIIAIVESLGYSTVPRHNFG